MVHSQFSHVRTWVFDLDNTLYHPSMGLFERMNPRINAFVMRYAGVDEAEATVLRNQYWREHGSTMHGLIHHHGMSPAAYLDDVHDIDLDHLTPDAPLAAAITALRGRKIVYTNGTSSYARRVLAQRGLGDVFAAVYGIEEAALTPKPQAPAFATIFGLDGTDPKTAAMFEDEHRNLVVPHALGMKTVHVADVPDPAPHIHHHTDDLTAFLSQLA